MTRPFTIFGAILATWLAHSTFAAAPATPASLDQAFELVKAAVDDGRVPGAVALVTQNGKLVRQEAYGLCDREPQRRMQTDTICWLASLTKPITAAAAMKLVEEGKLSLDVNVEEYLPEFKTQPGADVTHQPITVRQLMCHASGIRARPPLRPRDFFEAGWLGQKLPAVVAEIAKLPLEFTPDSKAQYSNAAPYVLGRIIELRSGQSYAQFVRQKILTPAGMNDTYYAPPASVEQRMAVVYRRRDGKEDTFFRFDPNWKISMAMPDGGLFGTAADVARFAQLFLDNNDQVLAKSSVKTMLTRQSPGWGLGWNLENPGRFEHTGSAGTYVWGDRRNGTVGVLFFQIQDHRTVQPLRDAFQAAVTSALQTQ